MWRSLFLIALVVISEGVAAEGDRKREEATQKTLRLEAALKTGLEMKDFTSLQAEVVRQFVLPHEGEREAVLGWLGTHEFEIGTERVIEYGELYRKMYPTGETTENLKSSIADRRLRSATREERARVYWEAVRRGEVDYGARFMMPRSVAIGRACSEGLEEFADAARTYAVELDDLGGVPGVRRSRVAQWNLRFRHSARDGDDALRLHAERLLEMEPKEVADLMSTDLDFRQATLWLVEGACPGESRKPVTEACRALGRLFESQEKLRKEGWKPPQPQFPPDLAKAGIAQVNWMSRLEGWTSEARHLMLSEEFARKAKAKRNTGE